MNGVVAEKCTLENANARIVAQDGKISAQTMTIRAQDNTIKSLERIQRKYESIKESLGKEKVKSAELQAQLTVHINNTRQANAMLIAKEKAAASGKERRKDKQLSATLKAKQVFEKEQRSEQQLKKRNDERMVTIKSLKDANGISPMVPMPTAFIGGRSNTALNYQGNIQQHELMLQQQQQQQQQAINPAMLQMFTAMMGQMSQSTGTCNFPTTPATNVATTAEMSVVTGPRESPSCTGMSYKSSKVAVAKRRRRHIELTDTSSSDDEDYIFSTKRIRGMKLDMSSCDIDEKSSHYDNDNNDDGNLPSSQPSNVSDNEE